MSPESTNKKGKGAAEADPGQAQTDVATEAVLEPVVETPVEAVPAPAEEAPAPEVVAVYDPLAEYPDGVIVDSSLLEPFELEAPLEFDDYALLANLSAFETGMLGRTSGKYARPFSAWHAARVAVLGG